MFRLSMSHLQASFVQMTSYMLIILRIMVSHNAQNYRHVNWSFEQNWPLDASLTAETCSHFVNNSLFD
jgi:hypothetical protein